MCAEGKEREKKNVSLTVIVITSSSHSIYHCDFLHNILMTKVFILIPYSRSEAELKLKHLNFETMSGKGQGLDRTGTVKGSVFCFSDEAIANQVIQTETLKNECKVNSIVQGCWRFLAFGQILFVLWCFIVFVGVRGASAIQLLSSSLSGRLLPLRFRATHMGNKRSLRRLVYSFGQLL